MKVATATETALELVRQLPSGDELQLALGVLASELAHTGVLTPETWTAAIERAARLRETASL